MSERRDNIRVHIQGKEYSVVGGEFRQMLEAVKQIVGRRFVSELKVWQLPGSAEEIQHQLSIGGYRLEGGRPVVETEAAAPATGTGGSDRIRLKVGDYDLAVVGGAFQEMLDAVKKLPGRRFNSQTKAWEIPGDAVLVKGVLESAGFQLEGAEKLPFGEVPPMEPLPYDAPQPAPDYEPPYFGDEEEAPAYEPPDWWDDDSLPPPLEPEGWADEADRASFGGEPPAFPDEADPFAPTPGAVPGGDRIRIRIGDSSFVVIGGAFQAMLAVIKKLPGRRFNGQEKVWEIPGSVTVDAVDRAVVAAGFMLLPE